MKRKFSKPSATLQKFPDCNSSPPYPPNPPPTGEIPGEGVLEFVYYGTNDTAKGYNDGKMILHTMRLADEEQLNYISLRGGPHKRRTLSKLDVKLVHGTCTLVIQNAVPIPLQLDAAVPVPAGSTFSLQSDTTAVLEVRSVTGPGLGGGSHDDDTDH